MIAMPTHPVITVLMVAVAALALIGAVFASTWAAAAYRKHDHHNYQWWTDMTRHCAITAFGAAVAAVMAGTLPK
jgi:uncharacterized membrane protein YkvI